MDALKFITCGSVDDGKSTLIGRLLVDSRAVLADQLASVTSARSHDDEEHQVDLAALTDGLSAEREQGITIDVAWRYFTTPARKFIIGDCPGHEQYTRNMVTAASGADAAVVLVDATKLDWRDPQLKLLAQTRRHSLLVNLLRVSSIVIAINKLDAVEDPALAFAHIRDALQQFAEHAGITLHAVVPISALKGHNVVTASPGWAGYEGPSLLELLEQLPNTHAETELPFAFAVQWVEKAGSASADTSKGRRIFWGRVATGSVQPGQTIRLLQGPHGGNQSASVVEVLSHTRQPKTVPAGHSAGIVLDRELDVSRGDWLLAEAPAADPDGFEEAQAAIPGRRELHVTLAWMDNEPLVPGRVYWALHGHRWVKARVKRIEHQLDIQTLERHDAEQVTPNSIAEVELLLQEPVAALPYTQSRALGAMVLVDTASHATAGAVMVN